MQRNIFPTLWLACILGFVGCNILPDFVLEPTDLSVIPGGPGNVQPFFGRIRSGDASQEMGDFILASCGCGDWRAVIAYDDGTFRHQFPVQFYTEGPYDPDAAITVFGQSEPLSISGNIDQAIGNADGRIELGVTRMVFEATRGENHGDTVSTCIYCHVGNDPIYPLPEDHPDRYKEDPTVCLDCHSASGS